MGAPGSSKPVDEIPLAHRARDKANCSRGYWLVIKDEYEDDND